MPDDRTTAAMAAGGPEPPRSSLLRLLVELRGPELG